MGEALSSEGSVAGLQEQAQNGTPAQQAQAKKMLKSLQLKVDGRTFTEELPFEIPEEAAEYMTTQLQKGRAAEKRFQESRLLEQQVQQFVSELKGDTRAALKKMGIDPRDFAAQVLEDELKKAQMSPEQLEKMELEQELKRLQDESKQKEEEFTRREFERVTQQEYERIDNQMTSALDKSDLPKSPYVVKKLAEYMMIGAQNGIDLTAEDLVPIVREEIMNDLQTLINAMGEDKVENFIGKDVLNKIRKKNIAKSKVNPATVLKAAVKDTGKTGQKTAEPARSKKDMKDFFGF
jgi:hypothetical protein